MSQRDQEIIASLNQWGIPFLSSPMARGAAQPLEARELIARLIQSDFPRFKLGAVAFFLVHPEKGSAVLQSLSLLSKKHKQLLKYYYTAAVYLQRYWKSQFITRSQSLLLDYFSKELGLPEPTVLHGRWGLAVLEESLQQISHEPYNYMASFNGLARLLQQQQRVLDETAGLA